MTTFLFRTRKEKASSLIPTILPMNLPLPTMSSSLYNLNNKITQTISNLNKPHFIPRPNTTMSLNSDDIILSGQRISDWARSMKLYISGICFPSKANPFSTRSPDSPRDAEEESVVSVSYEDAEVVIERLRIRAGDSRMDSDSDEGVAASTGEMREAFGVFDADRDGYIGARELQRVLCALGYKEGRDLRDCERMIRAYDDNCDGRIDFEEFVKFVGMTSFSLC